MDNSNLNKDSYLEAKEKVKQLKGFYFSLIFYVIVNSGLIYIWYEYSSHSIQWFWFPIVIWGIGLLFKALRVYEINILFGKQWEERQMKKYLGKNHDYKVAESSIGNAYENAKKKVECIKGFYSHFAVYFIVNAFIVSTIVINSDVELLSFSALSTPFFWGIGLVAHGLGVFGPDIFFGKDWEDKKINELIKAEDSNFNA